MYILLAIWCVMSFSVPAPAYAAAAASHAVFAGTTKRTAAALATLREVSALVSLADRVEQALSFPLEDAPQKFELLTEAMEELQRARKKKNSSCTKKAMFEAFKSCLLVQQKMLQDASVLRALVDGAKVGDFMDDYEAIIAWPVKSRSDRKERLAGAKELATAFQNFWDEEKKRGAMTPARVIVFTDLSSKLQEMLGKKSKHVARKALYSILGIYLAGVLITALYAGMQ